MSPIHPERHKSPLPVGGPNGASWSTGPRRAAEMQEVAKTVRDPGLPPDMSTATVAWQDRIGALNARPEAEDYAAIARAPIPRLTTGTGARVRG